MRDDARDGGPPSLENGETIPPPAPITYRFERADCWRLGCVLYRPSFGSRVLRVLFLGLCITVGFVIGHGYWPSAAQWGALLGTPLIWALLIALVVLAQFTHLVSAAILWGRFRSLAIADKDVTLTFGPDALAMDVAGTTSTVPWANFVSRIETGDSVLLALGKWEAVTIPRRAFAEDASWRAAKAFLQRKVPHGEA